MTMANEQRLRIIIDVVDRASNTVRNASRTLRAELASMIRQLRFWALVVGAFVIGMARASERQQVSIQTLRRTVDALGSDWVSMLPAIRQIIAEQNKLSKFSEVDLTDALNTGANALGDLRMALRALPAAVELASDTGMDLRSAIKLIADALMGDRGALKQLFDLQIAVDRNSNPFEILTAIMRRYEGAAADANTPTERLRGAVQTLGQQLGEEVESITVFFAALAEGLGKVIPLIDEFNILANTEISKAVKNIEQAFIDLPGNIMADMQKSWQDLVDDVFEWIIKITKAYNSIPLLPKIPLPRQGPRQPGEPGFVAELPSGFTEAGPSPAAAPVPGGGTPIPTAIAAAVAPFVIPVSQLTTSIEAAMAAIGDIPGFQHGGIVTRPTLAMVGEGGAEAIVPLSRRNGMRGMDGPAISFHLHADNSIIGISDIDRYILRLIRTAATGGGFNRLLEGR